MSTHAHTILTTPWRHNIKRTDYWREYAIKNKQRRKEIEKRSRDKRRAKLAEQVLTDDECHLEPVPEGWLRGRTCRDCGGRVVPTSYYYCAFHYAYAGEEHFVTYSTAEAYAE